MRERRQQAHSLMVGDLVERLKRVDPLCVWSLFRGGRPACPTDALQAMEDMLSGVSRGARTGLTGLRVRQEG